MSDDRLMTRSKLKKPGKEYAQCRKQSVKDVTGNQVLTAFDVYATAGYKTALQKQFTVTANSNGQVVIAFTQGGADNPFISGIELYTT
jgi:hypothetical protein